MSDTTDRPAASAYYLIAGNKPWIRAVLHEERAHLPGTWRQVSTPEELDAALVDGTPRYIFFVHWSHIVPSRILDRTECVCFHMTDVPYGRGGSPLQNLIARGHRDTMLTALRMVPALDAGPVYRKRPLSLEGGAEEIYVRMTRLATHMIEDIVTNQPQPVPQEGEPVVFRRRTPDDSRIQAVPSLQALFDHVRMLDATGYPHAFLEHGGFRYEFTRPALYDGHLMADVRITPISPNDTES